jgi:hypothetical protein
MASSCNKIGFYAWGLVGKTRSSLSKAPVPWHHLYFLQIDYLCLMVDGKPMGIKKIKWNF